MHLHSTKGIALHHINYSENSIIARIYTEKFGLQSYLVRGVRKSRSATKLNLFRYLTPLDLVVYHKPGRDLQFIREISVAGLIEKIYIDPVKSSVAIFLCEVIGKSVKEQEPDRNLFGFLTEIIGLLANAGRNIAVINLFVLLHLTRDLGFFPSDNYTPERPFFHPEEGEFKDRKPSGFDAPGREAGIFLHRLINSEIDSISDLHIPQREREELFGTLLALYRYHLPGFREIKSYEVLRAVF